MSEKTLAEFEAWPSLKRFREIIITEKIDGTNAQISIDADGTVRAGSRTRWVTPEADNFGFAAWVSEHAAELRGHLGIGRHFGEWYGAGIQRRYGLDHKRFALFDTHRWAHLADPGYWAAERMVTCYGEPDGTRQKRVTSEDMRLQGTLTVVPEVYCGPFDTVQIDLALLKLKTDGSRVVPGFMDPEGVVVFDPQTGAKWKKTLGGDGHKGEK